MYFIPTIAFSAYLCIRMKVRRCKKRKQLKLSLECNLKYILLVVLHSKCIYHFKHVTYGPTAT